jgi:hypothetical protein
MFILNPMNLMTTQEHDAEANKWHCRLGHLHFDGLKKMHDKGMVAGLPKINGPVVCEACIQGKQTKNPFVGSSWRAQEKLELIHTDLCGPMHIPSLGKSKYFLLFIDDLTRMCWIYFLINKHEALGKFKVFRALVEKESGCQIKTLRSDRGGEFCSQEFNDHLE